MVNQVTLFQIGATVVSVIIFLVKVYLAFLLYKFLIQAIKYYKKMNSEDK
jgi:hypothetical protein